MITVTPDVVRLLVDLIREQIHHDHLTDAGLLAATTRLQTLTFRPGQLPPDPILRCAEPLDADTVREIRELIGTIGAELAMRQRVRGEVS